PAKAAPPATSQSAPSRSTRNAPPKSAPSERPSPAPIKRKGLRGTILVAGDRLSGVPSDKIEMLRKKYRIYFPSMEFTGQTLQRMAELDSSEGQVFELGFSDMNRGLLNKKDYVRGTDP